MECTVYDIGRVKEMAVLTGHVYFGLQSVVIHLPEFHFLRSSWF